MIQSLRRTGPLCMVLTLVAAGGAFAQNRPEYVPKRQVTGTIRSWGSEQMTGLMRLWEEGFHRYEPGVRFEDKLRGTVSAMGGVYAGAADLALMGREVWPNERMAFRQVTGSDPLVVQVATGSFDVPTKADALVIYVHRDNPLQQITLAQLDAIFGAEHRRGDRNIRTWGEAGLSGDWAGHTITPYGYRLDNAAAIFFRDAVLRGSLKWNPAMREFANRQGAGGKRIDSGQQILQALAADPYGIAIANPHYGGPQVKGVAVLTDRGAVAASRETVEDRTYPLGRTVYIAFARDGDSGVAVTEFLRYVLSVQGQEAVEREGAYLPLPATVVEQQRAMLAAAGSARRNGN